MEGRLAELHQQHREATREIEFAASTADPRNAHTSTDMPTALLLLLFLILLPCHITSSACNLITLTPLVVSLLFIMLVSQKLHPLSWCCCRNHGDDYAFISTGDELGVLFIPIRKSH